MASLSTSCLMLSRILARNMNVMNSLSSATGRVSPAGRGLGQLYFFSTSSCRNATKKEWYEVTYEKTDGTQFTVKGKDGDNLLDIAINNDLDLEGFGACEGTLACSTCHLVFKQEDFDLIEDPCTDEELDMLDLAYGLTDTNKCVSLSGCGFLGVYLIGALDCLKSFSPRFLRSTAICGTSAGALMGASVVCGLPLNKVRAGFLQTATETRKWTLGAFSPGFKFEEFLKVGLDTLPEDAHLRANGRLHVSVTRLRDMTNVIFSNWESREDLIQTLRCSCFILGFSGMCPPTLYGEKYIDGGYTNRQPVIGPLAISISPYSGQANICPKQEEGLGMVKWANLGVNMTYANALRLYRTLMPPPPHVLNQYYYAGYQDALQFLRKHKKLRNNR